MNVFFTADPHFGHTRVLLSNRRPWLQPGDLDEDGNWVSDYIAKQRTREMDDGIIANHNAIVNSEDTVYILGDLTMSNNHNKVEDYARRLNGHTHWIFGNHDYPKARKANGFAWKGEQKMVKHDGHEFWLNHCSFRTWPKRHYGAINLYGHSHGNLPEDPTALAMDVGVDCEYSNYSPLHIDFVIERMEAKRLKMEQQDTSWCGEDHHTNRRR